MLNISKEVYWNIPVPNKQFVIDYVNTCGGKIKQCVLADFKQIKRLCHCSVYCYIIITPTIGRLVKKGNIKEIFYTIEN